MLAAFASPLWAAGITVGSGDTFNLNGGTVNLDCGDLVIEGTFNMGAGGTLNNVGSVIINGGAFNGDSGDINLSGDWLNTGGTFNGGTSQVTWNTGCSNATIHVSGDSDFYNLTVQTTTGRTIEFASGSTTRVSGQLTMNGLFPANLLQITSSSGGSPAFLIVTGSYTINQVNVRDNHALVPGEWIDFGDPEDFQSIDSGGNSRWFRNGATGPGSDLIRFMVSKSYNDGNPNPVSVTLRCNTGLPLEQTHNVSPGNPVNFVVGSIDGNPTGPDCEIAEEATPGYAATYAIPECNEFTENCFVINDQDDAACYYENVNPGDGGAQNYCDISNALQPTQLTVGKEWLGFEDHPSFFLNNPSIVVDCQATALGQANEWVWNLSGNDEERTFDIYPRWQGDTNCSVTEFVVEAAIVSEGCDEDFEFEPGSPPQACTITNTIILEGIPTLSELGLLLMVLMMLGVGLLTARRMS